ncbi:MAG: 2-dehydropantoate 2-reductase [Alphaproteobacteria bacterium]|nr:2-dehydropantoate 2-reductase [Alphaproteobacteria bacterium]
MKICVFGAGAIGGYLAGFLGKSGAEVSVVARGAHLKAIQDDGLRVELPEGSGVHSRPRASDNPAELGPQDAVLVTVKAPSLPSVADLIGPLLGPKTQVAFITNGIPWWYFLDHGGGDDGRSLALLDPGDRLRTVIGRERVIGGIAWPASSIPSPGIVRISGHSRGTFFGRPDGRTTPELDALAEAFRKAGLPVTVTSKIRDFIWEKLAFNWSAGPMCVLTRSPVRATYEEPVLIETSRLLMAEAQALIKAMGCSIEFDVERVVGTNTKLAHRPSVLQDLMAGRPMEIDALYSVPLEMAKSAGVAVPTMATLAALIRVRAREEGIYPKVLGA